MSWISKKIPAPAFVPGWWQDTRRLSITTIKSPTGPRFLLDFRSYCTSWVRTTKKGKKMVVCGAKNLHGFNRNRGKWVLARSKKKLARTRAYGTRTDAI